MGRAKRPREEETEPSAPPHPRYLDNRKTAAIAADNATTDTTDSASDTPITTAESGLFPSFTVGSLLAHINKSSNITVALSDQAVCKQADCVFTALDAKDVLQVKVQPNMSAENVLFPLDTTTAGPSRRAFVQALRKCVKSNTVPVSAVACYYFADAPGWQPWMDDASVRTFLRAFCTTHKILSDDLYYAVLRHNDEMICTQSNALLTSLLKSITKNDSFTQPLCQLLNDDGIVTLLSQRNAVLRRNEYLPSGELRDFWKGIDVAGYWLLDKDLTIERNGKTIFKHLAVTDTIQAARTSVKTVVIIGGASGTGKTCTLLSVGTSKELHIVVSMQKLIDEFGRVHTIQPAPAAARTQEKDIEAFAQSVRQGIRRRIEEALQATTGNDVEGNIVNVVLHVDEAGLKISSHNGTIVVIKHREMRLLIHAQERLAKPTLVEGSPSVWLAVRVAIAGTGLEGLYSGTEGSIASKFHVVTASTAAEIIAAATAATAAAAALTPDELTEKIVKAHLTESNVPNEALDDVAQVVMRHPEISRIAATNYRLLSYCLMELVALAKSPWEVKKTHNITISDTLYAHYAAVCNNQLCEGVNVPLYRYYDAALPYACMEGTKNFIGVNGLNGLNPKTAMMLIRVAYVAYLLRVVVVPASEMDTVSAELTKHGFTPVASNTDFASLLDAATAVGVFTWSKIEYRANGLPSNYIAAGAVDSVKNTVVGIPRSESPVQVSPAYVMLPRLLDGSLFTDGSPAAFERVASALLCHSLHVLGLVCGGCDRLGLYAAMCGPEYALRWHAANATTSAAKGNPPKDTFISFTRAVEVDLDGRLTSKMTEMDILLKCAGALRDMVLQDNPLRATLKIEHNRKLRELNTAIKNKKRTELLALVANVMFVINPAGQSPSPDAVLLSIGSPGKRGFLTARQDKREKIEFKDDRIPNEVQKCEDTLGMLQTLATGKGPNVKMEEFFFNINTESNVSTTSCTLDNRQIRVHCCVRHDGFFLSSGKV